MDEFVAKANIEHYKLLLTTETDPVKYALITAMLKDETLKAAVAHRQKHPSKIA